MPWTTPVDFAAHERLAAAQLNAIQENLRALKSPPSQQIIRNNDAAYTTTSATLVPVDTTNLRITLQTNGGDVMVWFLGTVDASAGTVATFDVRVDGTTLFSDGFPGGLMSHTVSTSKVFVAFPPLIFSNLPAGTHYFDLMWATTGGATLRLRSDKNDATTPNNVPVVFAAREIS